MPRVALTDTFLEALAALDSADAKRAVAFLDKLTTGHWARHRCVTCHAKTRELWLVGGGERLDGTRLVSRVCATRRDLCRLLKPVRIEHDLHA